MRQNLQNDRDIKCDTKDNKRRHQRQQKTTQTDNKCDTNWQLCDINWQLLRHMLTRNATPNDKSAI